MKARLSYRWFCIRLWCRELRERIAWRCAWLVPRKIALLCFVRVCAASGDEPSDITYESAYRAWEVGVGQVDKPGELTVDAAQSSTSKAMPACGVGQKG